jgi:probable LLM family oxidoreductase
MIQLGIDSFATTLAPPSSGAAVTPAERLHNLLAEIELADRVGIDFFGVGEHHRAEFVDSAPAVILAAAAARTQRIRLTSAVTVLSAADPVRVFEEFATLDLISRGRAEITAGRGSSIEAFPLFGHDLNDYDALFSEKLGLLLKLREDAHVHWSGRHRPALSGQGVFPRPLQNPLPIWLGVGGTPQSFIRAGQFGLPLMVAIIGGEPRRFRSLVDLYREAGSSAGFSPSQLKVGVHAIGYLADSNEQAAEEFYPGWAQAFTQIGKERGWPPATRAQFDAARGASGAYLIGDADTVAQKIMALSATLGGLARISFQMSVAALPHAQALHAIEILGTQVAPAVRRAMRTATGVAVAEKI